ncbi:hypothetical protein GCM10009678_92820 [Actinomadura kijaniata]
MTNVTSSFPTINPAERTAGPGPDPDRTRTGPDPVPIRTRARLVLVPANPYRWGGLRKGAPPAGARTLG